MSLSKLTPVLLSDIRPTATKLPLPWSSKMVQIVEISNKPQKVPVSESTYFCLGFFLSYCTPIHLLGLNFLEKHLMPEFFSQKREIILEFESTIQNSQQGELDDLWHLLFVPAESATILCTAPQMILAESTVHLPVKFR